MVSAPGWLPRIEPPPTATNNALDATFPTIPSALIVNCIESSFIVSYPTKRIKNRSPLPPSELSNKRSCKLSARRLCGCSLPDFTLFLHVFAFHQTLLCSSVDPCLNCEVAKAMKQKRALVVSTPTLFLFPIGQTSAATRRLQSLASFPAGSRVE